MNMRTLICIIALLCIALGAQHAAAGERQLQFTWQQEISDDFDGWYLHYGTASGVYDQQLWVPYDGTVNEEYTATKQIVAPDGEETEFFFALTAVDKDGNESGYSNEVSAVLDFKPPAAAHSLTVTVVAQ